MTREVEIFFKNEVGGEGRAKFLPTKHKSDKILTRDFRNKLASDLNFSLYVAPKSKVRSLNHSLHTPWMAI